MTTVAKKSAIERAWSTFRRSLRGKAECVVVCQLRRDADGVWECEWVGRHWIDDAPVDKLPPGVPGAIILSLGSETLSRSIGGNVGSRAGGFLRDVAERAAQEVINPMRGRNR
jgi:hypothetical protein